MTDHVLGTGDAPPVGGTDQGENRRGFFRQVAAGAVAAKHMAPDPVGTVGIMGTGVQARLQIMAAHLVRPFERVLVWGRDAAMAEACAADIAAALGIAASVESDPARLAAESELVVTTTPAREPVFKAEWLHAGLHITAMGSDQAEKNEIEPKALAEADIYVCDRVSQCEKLGELRSAIAAGVWDGSEPAELGAIASGQAVGRRRNEDITICDLTGTGAQDTAIATLALARCKEADIGTVIAS